MKYFLCADACIKDGEGLSNPFAFARCEETNVQDAVRTRAEKCSCMNTLESNDKIAKLQNCQIGLQKCSWPYTRQNCRRSERAAARKCGIVINLKADEEMFS